MAKRVKFNLIIDDKAVRDLNGIKENFNIDDLIDYYYSGILERWLDVRGFEDELNRIRDIKSNKLFDIVTKLADIFQVQNSNLEKAIYHIEYIREKREKLEQFRKDEFQISDIIDSYHNGYNRQKSIILENSSNRALIKESVSIIENEYLELFKLNYRAFFVDFFLNSPLTVLPILMNKKLRGFLLQDVDIHKEIKSIMDIRDNEIKKIYSQFKSLKGLNREYESIVKEFKTNTDHSWQTVETQEVLILQSNSGTKIREIGLINKNSEEHELTHIYAKGVILKGFEFYSYKESHFVKYIRLSDINGFIGAIRCFRGETNGYWKDIESDEKSYLILKMSNGSYIRNLGFHGEELSINEVNGVFPILKGIDYKSNSVEHTLYYIEI
jgi:hypothetical protein